jgi:hypothetical protein
MAILAPQSVPSQKYLRNILLPSLDLPVSQILLLRVSTQILCSITRFSADATRASLLSMTAVTRLVAKQSGFDLEVGCYLLLPRCSY